jgi:selenocysteine lyase/cysteine desulfurase
MREYLAQFDAPDGFLDFAAIGPPGRLVRQAVADDLRASAEAKPDLFDVMMARRDAARATIARFLGTDADHVTYYPATSDGLFQAAFGLVNAGGNVVVPAGEFPANRYPWLRAEQAGGPAVRLVEPVAGRITPELLAEAVDDETRAIALSLVDYATGFRIDIDAVAALAGDALLVVDAIQGVGAIAADLGQADVVVAGGEKWMRAGIGSGLMAVSDRALSRLEPILTGWWGVQDAASYDDPPPHPPLQDAERFQLTYPDPGAGAAIAAAIETIDLVGIDAIETAVVDRAEVVEEGLRRLDADVLAPWDDRSERAGIVTFRLPGHDATETAERLRSDGFIVSVRGPRIRVSPHAATPMSTVDAFLDALDDQVRNA